MILHPKPGQRVRIHYAPAKAEALGLGHQDAVATVVVVAAGPGPRNAQVRLVDGRYLIVPRGNLVPIPEASIG